MGITNEKSVLHVVVFAIILLLLFIFIFLGI